MTIFREWRTSRKFHFSHSAHKYMHWLHHNVTLSVRCCCCTQVGMFWNNSALPLLNTPTTYTRKPVTTGFFPPTLPSLCPHGKAEADWIHLLQTRFWQVLVFTLKRFLLWSKQVFTSSEHLRLNPDSEVFSSQQPARANHNSEHLFKPFQHLSQCHTAKMKECSKWSILCFENINLFKEALQQDSKVSSSFLVL